MELSDLLSDVVQGARVPAKHRGTSIKPAVNALTTALYENGALPDALADLVDVVTAPNHLDQASLNAIVRNLYPATAVASHHVVKVVGCLGHGVQKPSLPIQAGLLRWLIMIYHVVEKQNVLSSAYSVLFNLLDTSALRPQLCHLLALITRRRHVRPYRIQSLLHLSRQTGNDPPLTALLRVFKDYYPEIIVGEATRGKAAVFKHPDLQWRDRLAEIQQAHAQARDERDRPRDAFRVARQQAGSRKAPVIPEVHTSHAKESSVTLEEIETADDLIKGLETIEMPNQLISVLGDPLLQKLMLLKPDSVSQQRVGNWLAACTQDLVDGEADDETESILAILQGYVSATKNVPPVVLGFFSQYLRNWDGRRSKEAILTILAHTPIPAGGFADLYSDVFQPLERTLLDGSAASQLNLLACYNALLRHWSVLLLSQDASEPDATAVSELASHVNKLCLATLQTEASSATTSAVLDFYEECACAFSSPTLLRHLQIVLPPFPLVYMLFFSSDPAALSRLCGLLAKYKVGFQAAMSTSRTTYATAYVNGFNGFLMDICNCLWRSRAFYAQDANSHACLVSNRLVEGLKEYTSSLEEPTIPLKSQFTLSTSPALALFSASHMRQLEEAEEAEEQAPELQRRHAGPVFKETLNDLAAKGGLNISWKNYRLGVLSYLESHGLDGVGELLTNTMTTLIKR